MNSDDKEVSGKENYKSQGQSQQAASIAPDSAQNENDKDGKSLQNGAEANIQTPRNCHTPIETAAKSVTGQENEDNTAGDPSGTKKSEEADGTQDTGETHKGNIQHGVSLEQSRAALRSLPFHQGFMKASGNRNGSDSNDQYGPRAQKDDNVSSWAESVVSEVMPEDVDDQSPSRLEWLRQKREDNEKNTYLDQIMSMVGMENVKALFLAVKARVKESKADDPCITRFRLSKLRLRLLLHGKDGTGKKSIAKLYSQFLHSIGAVNSRRFSKMPKPMYTLPYHPFTTRKDRMLRNPPTVVLCEADLQDEDSSDSSDSDSSDSDSNNSRDAARVRNSVTIESFLEIAATSILIVSSRDESLLESRKTDEKALQAFQSPLVLPDDDDEELKQLVLRMIQKRGMVIEGGGAEDPSLHALVRRVARKRESASFSNVHHLEEELDHVCRRQAPRMQKAHAKWFRQVLTGHPPAGYLPGQHTQNEREIDDQKCFFTSSDLLGSDPKDLRDDNKSWKRLEDLIGLEKVKREFGDIIDFAQTNYRRELQGMKPLGIGLNRLFLGPPGVGKTTVAQLYGQILIDLGLLSGKKVMLRNPSDLIGPHTGQFEMKTKEVLEEANGNVLIIDDAHMLYPGDQDAGDNTDNFPDRYS
ncbi:hypothetical protein CSAL01_10850 [Colletotrichum salicis]|uniref:ATPase AAA-type core domain-containing protein n=1 Tax=Colletotrichum salicis TaxID=1209931 RepID=A0A135USK9_9PEZI|nr:hypothetical protein CSAL01_10850 [Colletotrichum salicis]